jgi:hypothetical protein
VLLLRTKEGIFFKKAVLLLKQTQVQIEEAENYSQMLDSALFVHRTNKPFGNSNRNLNRPLNRPLPASRDTKNIWNSGGRSHGRPTDSNKECY